MWFEFITNTNCNWDCPYCVCSRLEHKQMTIDSIRRHDYVFDIIKQAEGIEKGTIVALGGEIGLISDNDVLLELFTKFNKKIIVNTNGEFFNIDRSVLYPYIEKFFYHVAPAATPKIKIDKIDIPVEVIYGIVDDNTQALTEFVEYNNHLNISYNGLEFSKFNEKLYNKTQQARADCIRLNPFASIDLAREVLCMCSARGAHVTIPLTEENFIKVLTEENVFGENDMCQTCYRTCNATPCEVIIDRKNRFKKLLSPG